MICKTNKAFIAFLGAIVIFTSCGEANQEFSLAAIDSMNLKRGAIVTCGPQELQLGTVGFELSASDQTKKDFNLAVSLLHSFEYDEAEKAFAKIIDSQPQFAMAYWGIAMSNFHQVWPTLPTREELEKGSKAVMIAKELDKKSKRESAFIDAIATFYEDWKKVDHRVRVLNYEKAMEQLYNDYPTDKEAAIFYALALDGATDPADKTFARQLKAGKILSDLYAKDSSHPGIIHYIIHSYDYPEIAELALPAARKYASIAPSSAHAQHMPAHIFTRLGLWDEAIKSDLAAAAAAKCYAEGAGIVGHWDEELHSLDYLMYSYLQQGDNKKAKEQLDYLKTIDKVYPQNFKVAYAYAAMPARYYLENKMWKNAANLELHPANFPWQNFPWQKAIHHFARLLGNVHIGNMVSAETELKTLKSLHQSLLDQKDAYKANQVDIQIKAGEAWIQFKKGNNEVALRSMELAADMENKTEKAPVTPGEIIPAKELLGDLLMQLKQYYKALVAYEADLKTHRNRFNGLYGAATAAAKLGNSEKASTYFQQILFISDSTNSNRSEINDARFALKATK